MAPFFSIPYDVFFPYLSGYEWAFDFFEENDSKQVILDRIRSYLIGSSMTSHQLPQYFEPELFILSDKEIFVDAGFFIGDTTEEFIKHVNGQFKHIYGFETDISNIGKASRFIENRNITIISKGIWDKNDELHFSSNASAGQIVDAGNITVPVTSLDNFFLDKPLSEYPTFIKMDIEGAEMKALIGAENVIRKSEPILAICVYHKPEDIYELTKLIHKYNQNYKFFLRHYTRLWFETVLYAIPNRSLMKAKKHLYSKERQIMHKVVPLDTPFMVAIEPSSLCNIHCNYCLHSMSDKTLKEKGFELGIMSGDTFNKVVAGLAEFPQKVKVISMAWNGEPLFDKKLPERISVLRKSNVAEKITVTSNSLLLTKELADALIESGLDLLNISLQGMTAQKYFEICGTKIDFDELYNNIVYFYEHRNNCTLGIKIADTALEKDEKTLFYKTFGHICDNIDIEHITDLFAYEGVDYSAVRNVLPCNLTRYGEPLVKHKVCRFPFANMLVNCIGKVGLCCGGGIGFDRFDIHESSLLEIWNSAERHTFLIDQLHGERWKYEKCKNCTIIDELTISTDVLDGHETEILERLEKN